MHCFLFAKFFILKKELILHLFEFIQLLDHFLVILLLFFVFLTFLAFLCDFLCTGSGADIIGMSGCLMLANGRSIPPLFSQLINNLIFLL